nr:MAG TPA: hypothetical protein [Caudoviricetes sp.]
MPYIPRLCIAYLPSITCTFLSFVKHFIVAFMTAARKSQFLFNYYKFEK